MFLHLLFDVFEFAGIHALGDCEDGKKHCRKHEAGDCRYFLGGEVYQCGGQQDHEHRQQTERDFFVTDFEVRGNFPSPLALVLEAQYQHGDAIKREAPDNSEGVGFTKDVYISAAEQDSDYL